MLRYSSFLHMHILIRTSAHGEESVLGVFLSEPSLLDISKLISEKTKERVSEVDLSNAIENTKDISEFAINGEKYIIVKRTLIEN